MDENVMERAKKLPRTSRATISVSASEKIDDYESAEAWAEWEEEMKQYPGWEQGEGGGIAVGTDTVEPSADPGAAQARDVLMSQLLEDAETRCALVSVLVDAGLGVETVRSLFEMRVRSYVPNPHDVPEENNEAAGRMLVLLDNPERNLHVCNFGWARFRGCDVAFIAKYSPFVEMGAGSGWLSYLLRERGAEVESFDEQAGGTFVAGWRAWPWSANVKKGSVEVLSAPGRELQTLLLCWPDVCSSFAADCLTAHRGCRAVFIGEERGGCTANEAFFDLIESQWSLRERAPLSRKGKWGESVQDHIFVYERQE